MHLGIPAFIVLLGCAQQCWGIAGGARASIADHPYQVVVDQFRKAACGGALLTNRTAVTAASCFNRLDYDIDVADVTVRVGAQLREAGGETFGVTSFAKHPERDLVLLYLDETVPLRAEVKPVALPSRPDSLRQGDAVIISGYGNLTAKDDTGDRVQLQAAALRVVDLGLCKDVYVFSAAGRACAGGVDAGMCGLTDVGAPLVDWRGELVGVALRASGCGRRGFPTIFTDLTDPAAARWVADNLDHDDGPARATAG